MIEQVLVFHSCLLFSVVVASDTVLNDKSYHHDAKRLHYTPGTLAKHSKFQDMTVFVWINAWLHL